MNPLIKQLSQYGSISNDVEKKLEAHTTKNYKKKNDFFLKQGQVNSSLFVIESGLVRGYFKKNGKEINTWFGVENELIGSILPLYAKKPSFENVQFLEDTTYYSINIDNLNEIYLQCPEFNAVGRKIAESLCEFLEERIISLHTDNAEERYRSLMSKNPDFAQRINLGHIASFLGITPETLSRIRSRF